jgi:hypothetical protein
VPDQTVLVEEIQILAEQNTSTVLVDEVEEIEVLSVAQQGPPGPPGVSANAFFHHAQPAASDTWTVNHNLGFRPAVSLLSDGGKEMWAEVIHTGVNQFIAYFDAPTSGIAICS